MRGVVLQIFDEGPPAGSADARPARPLSVRPEIGALRGPPLRKHLYAIAGWRFRLVMNNGFGAGAEDCDIAGRTSGSCGSLSRIGNGE